MRERQQPQTQPPPSGLRDPAHEPVEKEQEEDEEEERGQDRGEEDEEATPLRRFYDYDD